MKKLIVFLIVCTIGFSCNKMEHYRPGDFYNCHHQQFWTPASIFNQLIGKWQLIYAYHATDGEQPYENVILIFTEDGILRVFRDGLQIQTTSFYIQQFGADEYSIATDQYVQYTEGILFFCGGEMECHNSDIGLYDFYYRKAF